MRYKYILIFHFFLSFFLIIPSFRLRFAHSIIWLDVYSMLAHLHILFHRIMDSEPVFIFFSALNSHCQQFFWPFSFDDIFLPNSSFPFDSIQKMFALYSITIDKCLYALHIMLSHTLQSIHFSYFSHLHTRQSNVEWEKKGAREI